MVIYKMTESEMNETLKILYEADRYLYDCLCLHLAGLEKKIEEVQKNEKRAV